MPTFKKIFFITIFVNGRMIVLSGGWGIFHAAQFTDIVLYSVDKRGIHINKGDVVGIWS